MDLPFERLHPDAELPSAHHPGDAGFDLRAAADVKVAPGERAMVPTGLAVAIPEGHAGLVLPRSGLATKHGLTLANAPGLIDAGYRGEIICAVVNLDPTTPVAIAKGDRIAQLVIVAVPEVEPAWAEELPASVRGGGGFGSTGTSADPARRPGGPRRLARGRAAGVRGAGRSPRSSSSCVTTTARSRSWRTTTARSSATCSSAGRGWGSCPCSRWADRRAARPPAPGDRECARRRGARGGAPTREPR